MRNSCEVYSARYSSKGVYYSIIIILFCVARFGWKAFDYESNIQSVTDSHLAELIDMFTIPLEFLGLKNGPKTPATVTDFEGRFTETN